MHDAREIRRALGHPVVDADGHFMEFVPELMDHVRQIGGPRLMERYEAYSKTGAQSWYRMTPEARRETRAWRPTWWGFPSKNTKDLATTMFPKLLNDRLDEFGIDYALVYPTLALFHLYAFDDELRTVLCRAQNKMAAELFRPFAHRMTPPAVIPMQTPAEAIAELEYSVKELGLKSALLAGPVPRVIPAFQKLDLSKLPPQALLHVMWWDSYGIDSAYDYDPLWKKFVELKVAPTFHSFGVWGGRTSSSNYVFNHIGGFAASAELLCKSLFMGGVTRRFPELRIGFLEGGVSWACTLFGDLVGHWKVRNKDAVTAYDPNNVDMPLLRQLAEQYGGKMVEGHLDKLVEDGLPFGKVWLHDIDPSVRDEWAACGIQKREDIRDLFVPKFFFGCEADSPTNPWAFRWPSAPFGARLNAVFGSDISHWDVPDMNLVLHEAYEPLEDGHLDARDLRDFLFTNPVRLHAEMNPDFFKGTAVEKQAAEVLAQPR